MEAALAISTAAVAVDRLEAVALGSGGSGLDGRLRVVVGPGLGVGWRSWGGADAGLGLGRVARDVHPLLGLGEVVACILGIPLVLASSVGGAVGNVGVVYAGRCLLRVAVGEGLSRTLINLRKPGVGNGRVGRSGLLARLCRGLGRLGCFSLGLLEEKSVRGTGSLDLSVYARLGCVSFKRDVGCRDGLTSGLQRLAAGATRGLLASLHQLEHGSNRILIAGVHVQQNTLQGHVLVQLIIRLLSTTSGGKSEELGEDEEVVTQGLMSALLRILLNLGQFGLVFLLELLGEGLLESSLLAG